MNKTEKMASKMFGARVENAEARSCDRCEEQVTTYTYESKQNRYTVLCDDCVIHACEKALEN